VADGQTDGRTDDDDTTTANTALAQRLAVKIDMTSAHKESGPTTIAITEKRTNNKVAFIAFIFDVWRTKSCPRCLSWPGYDGKKMVKTMSFRVRPAVGCSSIDAIRGYICLVAPNAEILVSP